jgi:CoA-transferase family III
MIPEALLEVIAEEGKNFGVDPDALLQRDLVLHPPTSWSPNRCCQLVETADGWIAVNLAREDDRAAVPAWLETEVGSDPWDVVKELAGSRATAELLDRAALLGLPVAAVGETAARQPSPLKPANFAPSSSVVDLSALWAGPLCGGLLAEAGLAVTKIEDPTRPDPTRTTTPEHDRRLNGRKRRITMAVKDSQLLDAIGDARILITSARPLALARLGLTPVTLFERNPSLIWVAITAHGFGGGAATRVGFGDDCAAAGGLVGWEDGAPRFLGDALADPLTGLRAAQLALAAVSEGQAGMIDVALAPTAAEFAHRAGLR